MQDASSLQYLGTVIILTFLIIGLTKIFRDPLGHIPGPFHARFTAIWLWYINWRGIECRTITTLHKKYGPVVRVAPNEVDIADGTAIHSIYIKGGGYLKTSAYRCFDINGFETIFSTLDPARRITRAKAVAPLFAYQSIIAGRPAVQNVVNTMMTELERRKTVADGPMDVLNLFRAYSMDSLCVYLLGESFNGIGKQRLDATEFVDDFAATGRFFYLPGWLSSFVNFWAAKCHKDKSQIARSISVVSDFATRLVDRSIGEEKFDMHTYQGRLLDAGVSREETITQVMDIMFAGTDGAALTLSMMCRYLCQNPERYERVRQELLKNPNTDPQSLPYLSGVIKESLRLSTPNPARLSRVVSSSGLHVLNLPFIPAGTNVGLGAYTLHHNPEVFVQPYEFMPERWLDPTSEMLRDSFYFGMGSRQCIGRNFASAGLCWAAEALISSGILEDAEPVQKYNVPIREWLNASVIGGQIELEWRFEAIKQSESVSAFNVVYDSYALDGEPYTITLHIGEILTDEITTRTTALPLDIRFVGSVYNFSSPVAVPDSESSCENCDKQAAEKTLSTA